MNYGLTVERESFRKEVAGFLAAELDGGSFTPIYDGWLVGWSPQFSQKLAQRSWIGATWPRKYGGGERTYLDRLILTEELMRAGAPVGFHWHADRQVGPAILAYGSEEQRQRFLPGITRGEISFCIGMTEPGAGSDLASLSTRARQDGDSFILDGQKTFITNAHRASHIYVLARTNTDMAKHRGISEFLVDLKTPGIHVRPLMDMTDGHEFNEVYFDNVRLPAGSLLGEKDRGWNQVVRQLEYERAGIERLMGNYRLLSDTIAYVSSEECGRRPEAWRRMARSRLAELAVEMEVGRLLIYRVAWMLTHGTVPSYEAAMAKAYGSEFQQRLTRVATQVLGARGQLRSGSKYQLFNGSPPATHLRSVMQTIGGGTSEVLRNIVAQRGLGMPAK